MGLSALACLAATTPLLAAEEKQPVAIQFTFDRPLDSSIAPFIVAASRGLFGAQHLAVTFNQAAGSTEAIARVAKGDADLALVDLNELIRAHDKAEGTPAKAVFVLFNRSPYAIVARKSRGIHTLVDVDGKTVGVADSDLSIRLWPAVARQNGINAAHVKFFRMSAAVREPILSAGQVDAVTGFSYLSAVNLRDRGVPASDLVVLRYADFGCEAYGFAVIANPAFAASRPDAVKGFVRALIAGIHVTVKEPERAVDDVVGRMENGARDLELERLKTVLADNVLTAEVRRNGLGALDPIRLERSIDQIAEDYKFKKRPTAADIFDESFLPPVAGRLIN
ncbi:ABC transporter substrate-binding protein [Bradyrhizobium sp.]|uniref:ABC transporter substrate-binding protein n=1 Tax=Bradyrhizobium sp. TaxID=376 RepID=UPI0025BF31A5|nr:ABC transporter substrate-binding protein [Bradyrhizobium sp.]